MTQDQINNLTNNVRNIVFLKMFGLKLTNDIFDDIIPNSQSDTFVGFRDFLAMNVVRQQLEAVYTHTTAGLKAINQPNWSNPKMKEKQYDIVQLSDAINMQLVEANKIFGIKKNDYEPYSSIKINLI